MYFDIGVGAPSPLTLIFLGILIVIISMIGRGGSRGPATGLPLTLILVIGVLMVVFGFLSLMHG